MPSVVLLLPSSSYNGDDFFAAAQRLGVDVIVASDRCHQLAEIWPAAAVPSAGAAVDGPRAAPAAGAKAQPLVLTQTLPLPFREPARAARELAAQVAALAPSAVLGVSDQTAVIAAEAAALLGLPGNSPEAAEAARNKATSRALLRAAGVPTPWFEVVPREASPAQLDALCARAPFPCVVKPLTLSASRGVIRANDAASLRAAHERVAALLRSPAVAERREPSLAQILLEAFLPGAEVAVEGLLSAGVLRVLALFDKPDPLDGPFFEETIYVTPSRHPEPLQREIARMAEAGARALGLREGPVHAELRLTPDGPRILEVAARSIGGLCGRTLRFGLGVTLEELLLRHALGERSPSGGERPAGSTLDGAEVRETAAAGVCMLPIKEGGVLREVRGLEAARAVPGIEDVIITARLDEELVPLPEGASYLGFAFARAKTPAEVEAALRAAQAKLSLVLTPRLKVAPRS